MKGTDKGFPPEGRAEFQRFQEELTAVQEMYSQLRQESWRRELQGMLESCEGLVGVWRTSLMDMEALTAEVFAEVRSQAGAASQMTAADWRQALADMAAEVKNWGEAVLEVLDRLQEAWRGSLGGGGDWLSWLGLDIDVGGLFHQGGVVEAHQGLLVGPERLLEDERLVKVQTGEGILPREAMLRLGEENFEALRQGRFGVEPGGAGMPMGVTIQVQALDASGVAALDWDRLVQRHVLPALAQEAGRRW